MIERRRFARRNAEHEFMAIHSSLNVKILDISVAGVLLESSYPVDAGSTGRLRLNLDGLPITVDVQVRRVVTGAVAGSGCQIGASFLDLELQHRLMIERFVAQ
jgi:hypothetical protein